MKTQPTHDEADHAAKMERRRLLDEALKASGIGQKLVSAFLQFIEDQKPTLARVSEGKSHPREEVQQQWRGIEKLIFELERDPANYPLIAEAVSQIGIPEGGLGRPAGSKKYDDRPFVEELLCRRAAGELPKDVKLDIASRMPGGGILASKVKRLERAMRAMDQRSG